MPAIETLSGITKQSDNFYDITGQTEVGALIDDLEFCTFRIRSGGRMRFVSGCTTTFTNCTIIEEDNAAAYGGDNFRSHLTARFASNSTVRPIFRGCIFIQQNGISRSDWDIPETANPQFIKSPVDGSFCQLQIFGITAQYNHFAMRGGRIDGLVVNCRRPGGNMEFVTPPPINNLTVISQPGQTGRHVVFLMNNWGVNLGLTQTVTGLSARNVGCHQGNASRKLILLNPKGDIQKDEEANASRGGVLEVQRTYKVIPFNPVTGVAESVKTVITQIRTGANRPTPLNVNNNNAVILNTASADNININLRQYVQIAGSIVVAQANVYRVALAKYGFTPVVKELTVSEQLDGADINDGNVLMLARTGITEPDFNTVFGYARLDTAEKIFDFSEVYRVIRTDLHNIGAPIFDKPATFLTTNNKPMTLTTAGTERLTLNANSEATVKTTATVVGDFSTGTENLTLGVNITGNVEAGRVEAGANRISGNVDANYAVNLPFTGNGQEITRLILQGTGAATVSLTDCTLNEIQNLSGRAITVSTNTAHPRVISGSGNITFVTPPAQITVQAGAVVGAWIGTNRSQIITATCNPQGVASLNLVAGNTYNIVADAFGYKRSATSVLNRSTTDSLAITLQRINDENGNALIPTTLNATDTVLANLITTSRNGPPGSDRLIWRFGATNTAKVYTFNSVAYKVERTQSTANSLFRANTIDFRTGQIILPGADGNSAEHSHTFSRGSGIATSIVPDLSAFTVNEVGATSQTDFVSFAGGAIIINSGAPIIPNINAATLSGVVNTAYANSDLQNAVSGASFSANMLAVPDATKSGYKANGGTGGSSPFTIDDKDFVIGALQELKSDEIEALKPIQVNEVIPTYNLNSQIATKTQSHGNIYIVRTGGTVGTNITLNRPTALNIGDSEGDADEYVVMIRNHGNQDETINFAVKLHLTGTGTLSKSQTSIELKANSDLQELRFKFHETDATTPINSVEWLISGLDDRVVIESEGFYKRELKKSGLSTLTLAEIEGSAVLAKQAGISRIQTDISGLTQ